MSEHWNRYSAFFAQYDVSCAPSFIFRLHYFQASDMCSFSWPFFRFIFFFFPFPLYHHFSFSIAELQCHFKLSSYLILILLLWFLIFPDDDLHFFFYIYLSNTFSPWTLHSFSTVEICVCCTSPYLHTSLIFLVLCRGFFFFSHISMEQGIKKWSREIKDPESHVAPEQLLETWWREW